MSGPSDFGKEAVMRKNGTFLKLSPNMMVQPIARKRRVSPTGFMIYAGSTSNLILSMWLLVEKYTAVKGFVVKVSIAPTKQGLC